MAVVDDKLKTLLDRIVPALNAEAVYLFGSRARGDHHEDSDYDLLVVVPDDTPRERRTMNYAYAVNADTGIPADIFPCTHTDFGTYKDCVGTLSYEASRFGRRVYGR